MGQHSIRHPRHESFAADNNKYCYHRCTFARLVGRYKISEPEHVVTKGFTPEAWSS